MDLASQAQYLMPMETPVPPLVKNEDSLRGFGFALSAYLLWGFLPIYMKTVAHISPAEVISHRILWSMPIAGAILMYLGTARELMTALRSPRMLAMASMTAGLISINWGIYVWAIGSGHALDAALGYYINPLFSVFLGATFLREKLARAQIIAIAIAVIAVIVMTVASGKLPVVALGLTVTWGFYAYLKKSLPLAANEGFMLEIILLLPFALLYILYLSLSGQGHFLTGIGWDTTLLMSAGLVTAIPLMLYANGAKLLKLSTIGIMQYIAPTMIFLTAVFVFDEPISLVKLLAFAMIWFALAIYTSSLIHQARSAGK